MAKSTLYFHPQIYGLFFEKCKGPFSIYIVSTVKVKQSNVKWILNPSYRHGREESTFIAATFKNNKHLAECGYLRATKANLKLHKR